MAVNRNLGCVKLSAYELTTNFTSGPWAEKYPPILTIAQAADMLQVPVGTLRFWRTTGKLTGQKESRDLCDPRSYNAPPIFVFGAISTCVPRVTCPFLPECVKCGLSAQPPLTTPRPRDATQLDILVCVRVG
jgi:hypothetical protein